MGKIKDSAIKGLKEERTIKLETLTKTQLRLIEKLNFIIKDCQETIIKVEKVIENYETMDLADIDDVRIPFGIDVELVSVQTIMCDHCLRAPKLMS